MLAHLWTRKPAPREFIEYRLCKEFKWLPSQLKAESYADLLQLLVCLNAEEQVESKRAQMRKGMKF